MYRVRADEQGVHVIIGPSTFWLRLRVNLRASRRALLVSLAGSGVAALALTVTTLLVEVPVSRLALFAGLAAGFALFSFVPLLATVVARSVRPSPLERFFPRAITMHADGLIVTPRDGAPRNEPWNWLAGARVLPEKIELSLAYDRQQMVVLQTDPATLARVRGWLEANGIVR